MFVPEDFSSIKISIASPERIREMSYGEVTKSDTINYRTRKPVPDGLFAENIFGPVKDWKCACGKYKDVRYRHVICEKCGVEVTRASVRRERMGHIELAAPVCHVWYLKGPSSKISLVLGMSPRDLERIIYFAAYVVLSCGRVSDLSVGQILTESDVSELEDMCRRYGGLSRLGVRIGQGAEAVRELLGRVNIGAECDKCRDILNYSSSETKRVAAAKRLRVLEAFRSGESRPEWMVLTVLPVLPPDLRPLTRLKDGKYASSDLNDLYRRVITRNNRLKIMIAQGAGEAVIKNEKRMLQEAVDALIGSSDHGKALPGSSERELKSLTSVIGGKQGRFRRNLLGKRVDYSGRSVIVVDPELKLHQCGLPREMALELFKPFVMKRLVDMGAAMNVSGAKHIVDYKRPVVWTALEEVVRDHPVLLNRAPTLHRHSVQAFEAVLTDGRAIKISPLVCAAFNADFDGDEMAVHVPLSVEAQAEARLLMLSSENILKSSDGKPVYLPTQDMVMGVYWLTLVRREDGKYYRHENERFVECEKDDEGAERYVANAYVSEDEALMACELGCVHIHDEIKVRRFAYFEGIRVSDIVKTTVGRIIFNGVIPQDLGFVDRTRRREVTMYEISVGNYVAVGEKMLARIIDRCFKTGGAAKAAAVLERIKTLGYRYSTKGAITVSVFDMTIPEEKYAICRDAEDMVRTIEDKYRRGFMKEQERYDAVVDTWGQAVEKVTDALRSSLDRFNPIWMMANSGARGTMEQVTQLSGMRGLMTGPRGRKIETPVKSSFREGLSVLEYFISSRGGRKGLTDTALKTADAGYLMRRLVDATHDVIITEKDCASSGGKIHGIIVEALRDDDGEIIEKLYDRIQGRFTSDEIRDAYGEIMVPANTFIDDVVAQRIIDEGVERVPVRSSLTCRSRHGVCAMCYGKDMATNSPAEIGEAVGVIAAQSMGEPCAQLTMRTFHVGGVATPVDVTRCVRRIEELFEARKPADCATLCEVSGEIAVECRENEKRVVVYDPATYSVLKTYTFGPREELRVRSGNSITAGAALNFGTPYPQDIMRICGAGAVQDYILSEIQSTYRSLGVEINDRHIEVVLRQMLRKVRIEDAGSTSLVPGETVDMFLVEEKDNEAISHMRKPANAVRMLLGITKAALASDSFLSAASFRDAPGVLADAAIKGEEDPLRGLKENVIIGNRIPAGTGLGAYRDMSPMMREVTGDENDDDALCDTEFGETDLFDEWNDDDVILDPIFPDIDLSDDDIVSYADIPIEITKIDGNGGGKDGGDDESE